MPEFTKANLRSKVTLETLPQRVDLVAQSKGVEVRYPDFTRMVDEGEGVYAIAKAFGTRWGTVNGWVQVYKKGLD